MPLTGNIPPPARPAAPSSERKATDFWGKPYIYGKSHIFMGKVIYLWEKPQISGESYILMGKDRYFWKIHIFMGKRRDFWENTEISREAYIYGKIHRFKGMPYIYGKSQRFLASQAPAMLPGPARSCPGTIPRGASALLKRTSPQPIFH